jgi:aminopeptidase YwaD
MRINARLTLITWLIFFAPGYLGCQVAWYYQWGMLPDNIIDYFIAESSGERAYYHIIELSEYNRVRTHQEFQDTLMESRYVADNLKRYGLKDISIERFGKTKVWSGQTGILREVSPRTDKIADINDLPFSMIPGSPNTDTEAELVYIGDAFNGDLDKMDLSRKIVLTSARPGAVLNSLIQKDIVGIVSYYSPRPYDNPLMIPDQKGRGLSRESQSVIFGFSISPRQGIALKDRLLSGEKIRVHATVRFITEETDIQVTGCVINGTNPELGEIIISAHLFEGYGVQGANDNISGSSAILETARVLNNLITSGKIARPKRNIRFIWAPEYSGTIPWVNAHKDVMKRTLGNINLDMVGLSLSKYKSSFILHRTSYGNASFLNDVLENYYRYVGETNQMNSVISGNSFSKRIVAPTGTDDPFYFQIESTSDGSDHDVFNDWGVQVPGVLMIDWPDPFYHTSQDRVDKCDPTQLKRVVFIAAISAYTIACADEDQAIDIAGEVYGNAIRRLGYQVSKSFDEVNKTGADNLVRVLKRGIGNIRGVALGEELTLISVLELSPSSTRLKELLELQLKSVKDAAESQVINLIKTAGYRAEDFRMEKITLTQSSEEKSASGLIPSLISDIRDLGYEGYNHKLEELSSGIKDKYRYSGISDPLEAAKLINGKHSILEIKYIIDCQNQSESSLKDIEYYFNNLKAAGLIRF